MEAVPTGQGMMGNEMFNNAKERIDADTIPCQ